MCTAQRHRSFEIHETVHAVRDQFQQSAERHEFAIVAYCFMPDHVHLLVEGSSERADMTTFASDAKQRSGFWFKRRHQARLWQPSYYDRILRNDEATISVIRYIVENPVRAGLVRAPADYPFSGSLRFTMCEILEAVSWQP
jgi:putative transposase